MGVIYVSRERGLGEVTFRLRTILLTYIEYHCVLPSGLIRISCKLHWWQAKSLRALERDSAA